MARNDTNGESTSALTDWSRRTVLKVATAGGSLAALGGIGAASQQDSDGNGDGQDGEGDDDQTGGDDGHFLADLVDPTFGYPLAADETDDLDLEHVVEAYTEESEGAHPDFPRNPEQEDLQLEFAFDPVGLQISPDEVVQFHITSGEHTVTAFHEKFAFLQIPNRVPENVQGFTSPVHVDGESWVYQFPEKGVYDILCLPHYRFGMVMRVVVFDPEADSLEDETFTAPAAGELPPKWRWSSRRRNSTPRTSSKPAPSPGKS